MKKVIFLDEQHGCEFAKLIGELYKAGDKEYMAALYILTANEELRRKAARFITGGGIDWTRIDKQDWSSGYKLLVELAKHLFRSSGKIGLVQGMLTWGDDLYSVAMQAIDIRKRGLQP